MKKTYRSVICLTLCISFLFGFSSNILAVEHEQDIWVAKTFDTGETYIKNTRTGEIILKTYIYDENENLVEDDLISYMYQLNNPTEPKEIAIEPVSLESRASGIMYRLLNPTKRHFNGKELKVSQDVLGPAYIINLIKQTIREETTFTIAINAEIRKIFTAQVGFEWKESVETASETGAALQVYPGYTCYAVFIPYMCELRGTLIQSMVYPGGTEHTTTSEGSATQAERLSSGIPDGRYEIRFVEI